MLRLKDVSKTYKIGAFGGSDLVAVRDISFDVSPGEVVSLIGESGSGKSTIGKMILRLSSVTMGSITFDGEDISRFGKRRLRSYYRQVQGVFQDPFSSFNPIFKSDHLFALLRDAYFSGTSDTEWRSKVSDALEAVSLDPAQCLHKYPHQLSGGQLQRLLVARALLLDIRLLVADEIISMLDASTRVDVLNLLADLRRRTWVSSSSPMTCRSATTSVTGPSSSIGGVPSNSVPPKRCSAVRRTPTQKGCLRRCPRSITSGGPRQQTTSWWRCHQTPITRRVWSRSHPAISSPGSARRLHASRPANRRGNPPRRHDEKSCSAIVAGRGAGLW